MKEDKAREELFKQYVGKTIYPGSVNQLDFNAGYDSRDVEVADLKMYTIHEHWCPSNVSSNGSTGEDCTCGLDKILEKYNE